MAWIIECDDSGTDELIAERLTGWHVEHDGADYEIWGTEQDTAGWQRLALGPVNEDMLPTGGPVLLVSLDLDVKLRIY
jgi:hypothetical protein